MSDSIQVDNWDYRDPSIKFPVLRVYTLKTPLIGQFSIKTGFLGPKTPSIRGVPVFQKSLTKIKKKKSKIPMNA